MPHSVGDVHLRFRLTVAFAALASMTALLLVLPRPAAAVPRIVQPPEGHAIVLGSFFRVVVALPRDVMGVEAQIAGHDVTDRLRRVRDGRYVGRIPTRVAGGTGFGFLLINYRDGAGRHSLGREVIIARRSQPPHKPPRGRLLSARLAGHRVAGVAELELSAPRADQWSVRVNGHDVSTRFADHSGSLRGGLLSASTGLHQGLNQVAVVAAREDGTRALRRFAVRVAPRTPIPDAGRPRRVNAGDRVRLGSPGGAAEPSRPGNQLEHSWTVVAAPDASKARLRHPHSERPIFRPDLKGSYWIADRVTERTPAGKLVGRSARDLVEIAATPPYVPPVGVPIETLVVHAGDEEGRAVGIEFGGTFYEQEHWLQNTVQVLTIDPSTMAASSHTSNTPAEALQEIESLAAGTIVVVEGRGLSQEGSWLEGLSKQIGLPGNWAAPAGGSNPTYSAIGTKGIPAGQGWGNVIVGRPGNGTWGALRGYIAPNYQLTSDPEGATYTFTPSTYYSYDTNMTGAGPGATSVSAKVWNTTVSGSVASGQTGFLAAEFDSGDLELLSQQTFTIAAAGGGENFNQGEVEALASWLEARESDPHGLVLLQSIGAVPNAPQDVNGSENFALDEAWGRASRAIGRLGGHQNLFNTIGGGGYSFLGGGALREAGVPAAEEGTTLFAYPQSGSKAYRLAGLLQLGHLGTLVPATSTGIPTANATTEHEATAIGNFELPVIAYQNPTPWPYEKGSEEEKPAVVAAGHFISSELCGSGCDDEVREHYDIPSYNFAHLVETANEDKGFKCPEAGGEWEGTSFTKEDCETAMAEFEKESRWVEAVRTYFGSSEEGILYPLHSVIGNAQTGLQAIGNDIEGELHPPKEAKTDIGWAIIFQSFATALEALDPEFAEGVASISTEIDASFNLAQAWAVNPAGESVFELETTVDETVAQVQSMAQDQEQAVGNLWAVITTDYGKLRTMYNNINTNYPQWNLPGKGHWSPVEHQLEYGLRGSFYRTFVPPLSETRTEPNGQIFFGYRDVTLPQNVCITHSNSPGITAPLPPECGGTSEPSWRQTWNLSEVICWDYYFSAWHTEDMGQHWVGAEYVKAGANAFGEITYNPFDGGYPSRSRGGAVFPAYSPVWHIAIRPEQPFSNRETPFPAKVAEAMSGAPESNSLNAGLPNWVLFESLQSDEVTECPGEWEA